MNRSLLVSIGSVGILMTGACCKQGDSTAPASASGAAAAIVASYAGKQITQGELDQTIAQDLYSSRKQGLETLVARRLIDEAAAAEGLSEEGLFDKLTKDIKDPSDTELQALYEKAKAENPQLAQVPFDTVKPYITMQAKQEAQKKVLIDYVEGLKKKANLQISLAVPRTEIAGTGPTKGPADAKVTITEFSDFECPACAHFPEAMKRVMDEYPGKVKLVFRDMPAAGHKNAQKAAEAAQCADTQGKFWEMHDKLFADQKKLDIAGLKSTAGELGLDMAKFNACLDNGEMAKRVAASAEAAKKAGVLGAPTFFINGREMPIMSNLESFKAIIDEELGTKPSAAAPAPAPDKAPASAPAPDKAPAGH